MFSMLKLFLPWERFDDLGVDSLIDLRMLSEQFVEDQTLVTTESAADSDPWLWQENDAEGSDDDSLLE